MNQILFFEENGIGNSMNKNIKFFAVSMMAFGIILLGKGGYALAKDRNEKMNSIATVQQAEDLKPTITYEQNNSKLNIKIDGKAEISSILYKWNNETEKELLNITGQKTVEREIDIPSGTNQLTIKVIYKDAKDFPYEQIKTFTRTSTKIEWAVKEITKIKITIEDSNGIESVSYKWNDEEETIENPNLTDNTKVEVLTEIPFGLNTLKVTVINMLGEKTEESLDVKGTTKPVIAANLSEDGKLIIEVTSPDNIENVDFSVNGEEYKLNISDFIEQGYTIEDLNNSAGLNLEQNESGKIIKLTYEFQTQQEVNEVSITAKTQYATESVSGTLVRPVE